VELKDFAKVSWLDNSSSKISSEIEFEFKQSKYYKQPTLDRDLHFEANGEFLVSRIVQGKSPNSRIAKLSENIPVWDGMRICVLDLNSKPLRVVGGGAVKL